ncbi:fumarylacetoacetase [Arundinibacter roseus]|uniref:fumarylacetoacetase n=1 Tax=Arundinibacter roseus TaxID=2070510 RepID=A0A4R4KG44_9BACT|nr:fumarylacetoacetase [Arundinibacter roseus]TDB65852.1 fumarylacetoacetase [Arundinibacter roseus]
MNFPASWLPISESSDFSLANLPFGIFSHASQPPRVGVAVGEYIIDMTAAAQLGVFDQAEVAVSVFEQSTLNALMNGGRAQASRLRTILQHELTTPNSTLHQAADRVLVRQKDAHMHLPVAIGDYTDFYSSLEHATNVGKLFRPEQPLMPNWKHLPVAYHGRASSVQVSGVPVRRPFGQVLPAGADAPVFIPTQALDYELELGFLIGKNSISGRPIRLEEAEDYIFGFVLVNDWSARDIQRWEYQPLGPFLSKNFATSISSWVVTYDALLPLRVFGPEQTPRPLPHLADEGAHNFSIQLEVAINPADAEPSIFCQTNARHLYWNVRQQIAHHTSSGCNLRVGDLLASGTISGPEPNGHGCLLEQTQAGKIPVNLQDGNQRIYLHDYDEVIMRGYGVQPQGRVGFGEVRAQILPANENP